MAGVGLFVGLVMVAVVAVAAILDRRDRARAPRQQVLLLDDTQLMAYGLEEGELVLDFFGGSGQWASYARGALVSTGTVSDTPAFTVRAAVNDVLDLSLFERLARWVESSDALQVKLEATGVSPLERPTSLEMTDGRRSLSVLEAHAN